MCFQYIHLAALLCLRLLQATGVLVKNFTVFDSGEKKRWVNGTHAWNFHCSGRMVVMLAYNCNLCYFLSMHHEAYSVVHFHCVSSCVSRVSSINCTYIQHCILYIHYIAPLLVWRIKLSFLPSTYSTLTWATCSAINVILLYLFP